jgi:iron complex transport system substrate-binding protein
MRLLLMWLAVVAIAPAAMADIRLLDDSSREIRLAHPAQRIVSLAPHLTELLFAAGAGSRVIAAVAYSDYPPPAARLPRIGSGHSLDLEAIVAARPDLIIAWGSGNPPRQVERLRALGLKVFSLEVRALAEIPAALERIGTLAGTEAQANVTAARLRARQTTLGERYGASRELRVFYQLLDEALMTVNGAHLISDVLRQCGATNVFANLPLLTARVDIEAVLAARPQAIVAGGEERLWRTWRERWQRRRELPAVASGALYFVPADLMHRPGPRVFDAAEQVCAQLDAARSLARR